jgi:PAS domain S-box-containing protein
LPLHLLHAARERWTRKGGLRRLGLALLLAGAYVAAAKLGFRAALVAEQVSPAWPPSGLALWALLLFGPRAWPAIWAGALVANVTTHEPLLAACGIATGNTLEAVAGAWMLRRFADVDRSLDGLRQVTALIMLAAVGATTISATIGVATLCAAGLQEWSRFGMLWRMWWLGDAMGVLLVATLLLTVRSWVGRRRVREAAELVALEGVAILATVLVFATRVTALTGHPLEYIVFPLVIWAGLRFGHPGAALVSATVSSIAIWGTLQGTGPFAGEAMAPQDSLILLQIYTGVTAASGLVLGAAIADRNRSEHLRQTDHLLAAILSQERDLVRAAPRLLRAICETLEWEVGLAWQVHAAERHLEYVDSWHRARRLDDFIADSRTRRFQRGIDLPGRVWATARPAWIYDVTTDANFPRDSTARRLNLHGGFAFPLLRGTRVLGVMEFFTRDPRQVDRSLLTLMETAGAHIGQFIDRRHAEQRVADSEALNSAIINAALDCVVTIDGAGTIREFNPAATRTFGFSREAAVGRELADLLVPPRLRSRHRDALRRCVDTGESTVLGKRIEMPGLRADGTEFPVELAITRVGGAGQPIFTAHMRDITDRKRAENERDQLLARERTVRLEAEAANRSKDQFLATVSHELRTPLTAILGWASMLKTRTFDPQRIQQIYESLERNAQAQAQIVGDLLDVSRIITGQLRLDSEPLDVCDAARLSLETIRPTAVAKGVRLEANIPPAPCVISGDSARLQQIIWNLLSNAAKFTPAGGTITVNVRQDPSHVVLEVRDTGIGIAFEMLPRVFDRFWQADGSMTRVHGGLGLGLALVRHLVELHGGEVSATSGGEGQGSLFVVWLPARPADAAAAVRAPALVPQRLALPGPDLTDLRALVVDDDAEARGLFAEILSGLGAKVVCAGSAAEAFQIVERQSTDVIVMDIGMPSENGFSLLRRIRAHERQRGASPTPAIAVTAYAGASARAEVMRAGFAAYLSKPAPPDEMLAAIVRVVRLTHRPAIQPGS